MSKWVTIIDAYNQSEFMLNTEQISIIDVSKGMIYVNGAQMQVRPFEMEVILYTIGAISTVGEG